MASATSGTTRRRSERIRSGNKSSSGVANNPMPPPVPSPTLSPHVPSTAGAYTITALCGHTVFKPASTSPAAVTTTATGAVEFCTLCKLRANVQAATNDRLTCTSDPEDRILNVWRASRVELANYLCETEGSDGCSADCELTLQTQRKFALDNTISCLTHKVTRRAAREIEEQVRLYADKMYDEADAKSAAAVAGEGQGATTTNTDGKESRGATVPSTNSTRLSRHVTINDLAQVRSRKVTGETDTGEARTGETNTRVHRDEATYRGKYRGTLDRTVKGYEPGEWVPSPGHVLINTSGSGLKWKQWERAPRRTRSGRMQ